MEKLSILCLFLFISLIAGQQDVDSDDENVKHNEFITKNQEKLLSTLFNGYSNRIRPCGSELNNGEHVIEEHEKAQNSCGPTRVKVHVYLRSVDEIDDKAMNFDMQLIFRQTWKDHRLSYKTLVSSDYQPSYISLAPGEQQFKIWAPDTFFLNEKEGYRHEIDKDNVMIRIGPDGKVIYTFRVTMTLACVMNFRKYPMDRQKCDMIISSYSHTINYIRYEWRDTSAILISPEFKNNVANFEFEQVKREKCLIDTATTGTYSCLKLALYFKRTFSFSHFVNLYLPGFILVVISWLSFWLSVQAISTRITFALFCFLTLIVQFVVVSPTFPPAQTYRSIDIWFVICLLFLSLSLIQCIIVYRITKLEQKPQYSDQQAQFYGPGNQPSTMMPVQAAMVVLPSQSSFLQQPAFMSFKREDELSRVPSKLNAGKITQHKRSWAGLNPPKKSTFVKPERRISTQQDMMTQVLPLIDDQAAKDKDSDYAPQRYRPNPVIRKWMKCSRSQKFDVLCRIFFPLAFFLFNVIYWSRARKNFVFFEK